MPLKTKDFSRETEVFIWNGGGEIRTLVLSKLHNNAYMLSLLNFSATLAVKNITWDLHTSFDLETIPLEVKRVLLHTKISDDLSKIPGPILEGRLLRDGLGLKQQIQQLQIQPLRKQGIQSAVLFSF